jgi:Ca2+-binding EF-hand superfamily protein
MRGEVDKFFDKYDINKDGVLERKEMAIMLEDMTNCRNKRADWGTMEEYINNFMRKAGSKHNEVITKQ